MTKHISKILFFLTLVAAAPAARAQSGNLWQNISESAAARGGVRTIIPLKYRTVSVQRSQLEQRFQAAPAEKSQRLQTSSSVIELPLPDGTSGRFRFVLSPVMAPELAAKYPEIQTYAGQGIDDPAATVRFDLTPKGFHAMILSPSGTVFIDPYSTASTDAYISYYKKDFDARSKQRAASDGCQTDTDAPMSRRIAELVAQRTRSAGRVSRPEVANGTTLRTYRLALAATGEYTAYQGGTV
ncbi:MAG: hypothetical protein IAF08_01355, partial [Rhizobacter sp.]|nr:hypothetical protein [Chlorobiales bacterium]